MAHKVLVSPPLPGPVMVQFIEDPFTATLGQTLFTLSTTHDTAGLNFVSVNGIVYEQGVDYLITATTVQWLNTDFSLVAGDEVLVKYQT